MTYLLLLIVVGLALFCGVKFVKSDAAKVATEVETEASKVEAEVKKDL